MYYYKIYSSNKTYGKVIKIERIKSIHSIMASWMKSEPSTCPSQLYYSYDEEDKGYYAAIALSEKFDNYSVKNCIVAGFTNELPQEVIDSIGNDLILTE